MTDRMVLAAAALAAAAALIAPAVPVGAALVLVAAAAAWRRPALLAVALAVLVGARAHQSWAALAVPPPPTVRGVAELVGDPEPGRFGLRVPVRLGGRRWMAEVGRDDEAAVRDLLTGDRVRLAGTPRPLRGAPRSWVVSRHLAGGVAVRSVGRGPPPAWWSPLPNALHRCLARGASSFGDDARALYLGLVVGDDRLQSDLTRYRFRASGLSHLLAVSGQNVAFLLAVCAPLLRAVGIRWRWVVGGAALVLFVLATRAEPSVLRAAAMAAVALRASSLGRPVEGARALALAVLGLLLVDPLLAHSTGFRLSVAATTGLLVLARPLAGRLPGPAWVSMPLAVTLAAQAATAPILLTFTDGLPPVATVANLLAVAPAGAVMTLGLSVGLVAGVVRPEVAAVLQLPTRALVGWVDAVATWSSRVPLLPLSGARLAVVLVAMGAAAVVVARRPDGSAAAAPSVAPRPTLQASLVAAAVVVALAAASPPRPGPGRHLLAPGLTASVHPCGEVTVRVGRGGGDDVLAALLAGGVTSAASVDGADRWTVAQVAAQLGARAGPSGPPCTVPP